MVTAPLHSETHYFQWQRLTRQLFIALSKVRAVGARAHSSSTLCLKGPEEMLKRFVYKELIVIQVFYGVN